MRYAPAILFLLSACGGGSGNPAAVSPAVLSSNEDSPLGINLTTAGLAPQTPEICFKDLMKQSGPWNSSDGQPFPATTACGVPIPAPQQTAWTQMCRSLSGHYPGGTYVCLYEGSGTLWFSSDAAIASQTPGRIVVAVTPASTANGILLWILSSDASDPVRNLRFLPAEFETDAATEPFHPAFLARWNRFKMVRFMNWQKTNASPLVDWSDRPTTGYYTQTTQSGVALEHMVQLANALHADPWFCMPHRSTDDFVREFATMVRDTLDPSLHVYLEYSNEIWNPLFEQGLYAQEQGAALGLSSDTAVSGLLFGARRSVEVFAIWEEVFGGTARLVRTLSALMPFSSLAAQALDWASTYTHLDALAVGPYFGLDVPSAEGMTVADVLDSCRARIDVVMGQVAEHRATATARGLDLVAYEGGQHLVAAESATLDLFVAANRDPGMKDLYAYYLSSWRAAGGHLFCAFASMQQYGTHWGSFGVLEWNDQPSAPKYDALLDFIQTNPRWW